MATLFVDIETTSLHPDTGEIWEVGLIDAEGVEHSWFLPVEHLDAADARSLDIGRFHQRHPQGAFWRYTGPATTPISTPLAQFVAEFTRLTWGHENHLCGASVSFDEERLRRLLWRNGQTNGWHYHLVDIEAVVAGWIAGGRGGDPRLWPVRVRVGPGDDGRVDLDGQPPWNSNHLSLAVGVDPGDFDRHTALGDCQWARAMYRAVFGC